MSRAIRWSSRRSYREFSTLLKTWRLAVLSLIVCFRFLFFILANIGHLRVRLLFILIFRYMIAWNERWTFQHQSGYGWAGLKLYAYKYRRSLSRMRNNFSIRSFFEWFLHVFQHVYGRFMHLGFCLSPPFNVKQGCHNGHFRLLRLIWMSRSRLGADPESSPSHNAMYAILTLLPLEWLDFGSNPFLFLRHYLCCWIQRHSLLSSTWLLLRPEENIWSLTNGWTTSTESTK